MANPRGEGIGPDYLEVDLGNYGSDPWDTQFALHGKRTRTRVKPRGAGWRNEVQLGSDNLAWARFYQPHD